MTYTITFDSSVTRLIRQVNTLIEQGWEPIGGLAVRGDEFYQSMIKFDQISGDNREKTDDVERTPD